MSYQNRYGHPKHDGPPSSSRPGPYVPVERRPSGAPGWFWDGAFAPKKGAADGEAIGSLPGSDALNRALAECYARARQSYARASLVLVQLDGLDAEEPTYLARVAEALTTGVAKGFRRQLGDCVYLLSLTGGRLAVLLRGVDGEAATVVAERLREIVSRVAVDRASTTASVGVAEVAFTGPSVSAWLSDACNALQTSKRLGRDRVTVASGYEQRAAARAG